MYREGSRRRQWWAAVAAASITFAHLEAVAAPVPAPAIDGQVFGQVMGQVMGQVVLTAATADGEQMKRLEAAVHEAAMAVHLQVAATRVARIDAADILAAGVPATGAPDPMAPVARLWIDAAKGSQATLYLTDGPRRRVYVRQVPIERGLLDRVALEGIALIVGSSLEALVAGREIGVSREDFARVTVETPARVDAQRPTASQPSRAPPPSLRDATVSAAYELVRASPLPYQHRVVLEYQSRWWRVRAGAGLLVAAPQRIGDADVGARLLTAGANLSAGAHLVAVGSVHLSVVAGLGIEAVHVEPNVNTAQLRATRPFWTGALSARGFGLFERKLTPLSDRWLVGLLVGVEVHPSPERYLISDGQGSQTVFQASRWRPVAAVFVGWRM